VASSIRTPKGVCKLDIEPFPYTVLWSRGITEKQVAEFSKLNPGRPVPESLDPENARARTYWFERFAWIVFFVRPTWSDVIHESVHAVGAAVRYAEAAHEVPLGGEVEAYMLDRLAAHIGAAVKAQAKIP
jgi:hypothetical protein